MAERRVPGYCALCRSRCGAVAVVEDDRLVRVEPFPEHPTGVALCVKGRAAPEMAANPNRLLHPMKRTRPKGDADPGWVRITWDEALDTVAAKLKAIATADGPEAVVVAPSSPSATPMSDGLMFLERFMNRFGTPNMCNAAELCNWHKEHAHRFTTGRGIGTPDFANTDCIVLWGHNPSTAWLDRATLVGATRARGAALVVVDPRQVGFAARADQWLRVRPGTDAALAMALIGEMLRHRLYDDVFVRRWTNAPLLVRRDTGRLLRDDAGRLAAWDEAANLPLWYEPARASYADDATPALHGARVVDGVDCDTVFDLLQRQCAAYTPESAESLTGVPAAQIRATAVLLGQRRPSSYCCWTGIGQHHNAVQTDRALAILMSLTGSFDAPGGNVDFGKPSTVSLSGDEFLSPAQHEKMLGRAARPLGPANWGGGVRTDDVSTAILEGTPYKVRALLAFGSNLLVTRSEPGRTREALLALDFYMHADPLLNDTATLADIVLPVCTQWEREGLRAGFDMTPDAASLIQLRHAALPPAGESRSDIWIFMELAKRLGFGADFWHGDLDAAWAEHIGPSGVTLDQLRAHPEGVRAPVSAQRRQHEVATATGQRGMDTDSRLIEIYSERLLAHGYDPLPTENSGGPRDAAYPLTLTMAKVPHYCHSQHRDVPSLRKRMPDPLLELHPDTALARGIGNGDWVSVSTPSGAVRLKSKFDRFIAPDVVCAQYGWAEANANELVSPALSDPISGSITHRGLACEVRLAP